MIIPSADRAHAHVVIAPIWHGMRTPESRCRGVPFLPPSSSRDLIDEFAATCGQRAFPPPRANVDLRVLIDRQDEACSRQRKRS